jgi:hypothetical protein
MKCPVALRVAIYLGFALSTIGCLGGSDDSSSVAASASDPWSEDVPYELEQINDFSFIDHKGNLISGFMMLQPVGMEGTDIHIYAPWISGFIPEVELVTPNGPTLVSINLDDYSPFLWWLASDLGPAHYDSTEREIHISGVTTDIISDGINDWPVLIAVGFALHGVDSKLFQSSPVDLYQCFVSIVGDPAAGLSSNEVFAFESFSGAELVID